MIVKCHPGFFNNSEMTSLPFYIYIYIFNSTDCKVDFFNVFFMSTYPAILHAFRCRQCLSFATASLSKCRFLELSLFLSFVILYCRFGSKTIKLWFGYSSSQTWILIEKLELCSSVFGVLPLFGSFLASSLQVLYTCAVIQVPLTSLFPTSALLCIRRRIGAFS